MEGVDSLADERKKAEFDVEAMKVIWAGSPHNLQLSDRISKLVANDPVFRKDDRSMLPRKELFKNSLRKAAYTWQRIVDLRLSEEEASKLWFYVDETSYIVLHWLMFIPAIKGQGTDEQHQKWLPFAYNMQIIGCYAQTELGHGSNVKGLETTSTFDPRTDEFVLHSPTLTSSKWWPGGLGKVSTHAVVYARLIIDGKDHGVHGMIYCSTTELGETIGLFQESLVGDIGMKFGNGGFNAMDQWSVAIRSCSYSKKSDVDEVTRDGKYKQSDVPRQLVLWDIGICPTKNCLWRLLVIYQELCVLLQDIVLYVDSLDHGMADLKFRFVGEWLEWLYNDVTKRLQANDFSTLPEAHACTAGLKSITTSVTADGIEECRKLCGGHGYLCSSGLPELYAVYVPNCTYEGDNIVLLLQVARFIIKTVSQLGTGKQPVGTIAYMGRIEHLMQCRCNAQRAEDWLKPSQVLEAFEARAARMSVSVARNLSKFTNSEQGTLLLDGFAELSADLVEAAVAHCQLIVVSKFIEKVQQADIGGEGAALANDQLRSLYTKVRPNAVALVDAFNYSDHYLSSILGRYDGNVYPKLYEAAWKDPLNESDVPDGYEEYVRPLLKQQLHTARL
ncbi:peroxisomal acyl-coenzyme a oxidase 1 [Phtheirospermum japonicum]|uniref:Acyl-coenzyme A oxidase n=1 Tax=Phtheirospermum japonicum TaxID=374723 RepID=A0A830DJS3_9LAMI|nr:peroxisomal acyl-coenzyme a oxidase 1 [Phtheirospermum japonicum]